jgi:hypothetical protein
VMSRASSLRMAGRPIPLLCVLFVIVSPLLR